MFGRLLRVTGTVLVIAAAFVTPVLATSTPASADTVVNGCTIVSNPTAVNFTNCPGADLSSANLSGVDLSFADLAGAQFAVCGQQFSVNSCNSASLGGANLTDANLTNASMAACGYPQVSAECFDADFTLANLTGATLNGATFATCFLNGFGNPFCGAANLSEASLPGANLTGATLGACDTSAPVGAHLHTCAGANLTGATLSGATLNGADLTATSLVPSDQTATATSPAGAVVTWPIPPSLPGASPGSCSPSSGSTFPIGDVVLGTGTTVTCQVLDDQGDVATGTFTITVNLPPSPTTSVLLPSNGATITGGNWLDADASSAVGIASVTFEVSGGSISDQVISSGYPTLYGYIGGWNSAIVPNGTYTLQSVATDVLGQSTTSAGITVAVNNPPPSTTVLIPSNGATQSGTLALVDAIASGNPTGVSFELSGGTLSDQAIATGTNSIYGWYAQWNTTTVPNGTYTLQSVATEADGTTVTSAPITVTVVNVPPSTSMVSWPDPLDSEQAYALVAVASPGATGVSFELGLSGSVLGTVTATPTTNDDWIYQNTPAPPCVMPVIGGPCTTATLAGTIQSVASYPGRVSVTSPVVNINVVIHCSTPVGCIPG